MKTRVIGIFLVACALLGMMGMFSSCGISHNSASEEKVNRILNANDFTTSVSQSWKDENGNFYYVIYLGKIEQAEIYNIESFYYSNEFEELTITEETVTETKVSSSYRNTVTKTVDAATTAYMKNTLELKAGLEYGIASAGVRDSFEAGVESKLGVTYTEQDESVFSTVVTTVRRDIKEKKINFKNACSNGKYYRYSVCADIDCYMNLYIPAGQQKASYQIYSSFNPDRTYTILLESDTANGFYADETFDLSKISLSSLEIPDEVKESHPELSQKGTLYDKINVGYSLGILYDDVYLDISDLYDKAVQNGGYSKVSVEAIFKSKGLKTLIPRDIEGYLGYCTDTDNAFGYNKWCNKDERSVISGEIDLKYFATNKKVYLIFRIPTYAYAGSFEISDIEITVKIN